MCQIHTKRMSQLVAYSGNICVWVVSRNECGGWQIGRRSASITVCTGTVLRLTVKTLSIKALWSTSSGYWQKQSSKSAYFKLASKVELWSCLFQSGIKSTVLKLLISVWFQKHSSEAAQFRLASTAELWSCSFQTGFKSTALKMLISDWLAMKIGDGRQNRT